MPADTPMERGVYVPLDCACGGRRTVFAGRTDQLLDAITAVGWRLKQGIATCDRCIAKEVRHRGAESPSDPGVGALENSGPTATGTERMKP